MQGKNITKFLKLPWYKIFAWLLILISIFFAVWGLIIDSSLPEDLKNKGWYTLFDKEYIKGLIISPLWVVIGFLFNRYSESENIKYKQRENLLFGLIKGKESVDVLDIREIIQDYYNQDNEYENLKNGRKELANKVELVKDIELTP